jgi:hypothetical protein
MAQKVEFGTLVYQVFPGVLEHSITAFLEECKKLQIARQLNEPR